MYNKVCANTLGGCKLITLQDNTNTKTPYEAKIKTGCRNDVKREFKFCENCLKSFSIKVGGKRDLIFLESLHPVREESVTLRLKREENALSMSNSE